MATWGVIVFCLAVSWVSAFPSSSPQEYTTPEDAQGRSGRIVSGWEASEGQIPYQLSIRMVSPVGTVFSCGATLIHHEWAMTAAHCTAMRKTLVIRAGTVALTRPAMIFESADHINHPGYDNVAAGVQPDDIGLIKFPRYVEYTDLIQPIRLQPSAHKNRDYSGIRLQASGWGLNWTLGVSPQNLNWVYLVGDSNEVCKIAYNNSSIIADSTICASAYNVSSQSTCQGDSGGPLVIEDVDGKPTQVGVTSFVSRTGCHTDFPAGFVRPGHYLDWFYEVTGIDFDWDPESLEASSSSESDEDSEETESSSSSSEEEDEDVEEEEENEEDNEQDKEEENEEDNEEDNEEVSAFSPPQKYSTPEDAQGRSGRIVSGWEARDGQIPYQLSIRMVSRVGFVLSCGATLIHHEWAMTAAHCTATYVTIVVRAGGVALSRPAMIFEAVEHINAPGYDNSIAGVQPDDIGLIKLNQYVEYTDLIQPIRLQPSADKNRDYSGIRLQASGWGLNWTNGVSPQNLNWVYLVADSFDDCKIIYGNDSIIAETTICASSYNVSSQSTCQGDSGGPLVIEDVDGKPTQLGVASFVSRTGCHTNFPAGFVRPGHYLDWFYEVTGIDFDWDPESLEASSSSESGEDNEEKEEENEENKEGDNEQIE